MEVSLLVVARTIKRHNREYKIRLPFCKNFTNSMMEAA
jgi:hypothetical protein